MFTAPEVAQVVIAVPATAVIVLIMVNVFVEVALPQGAFPLAVNVKVLLPKAISAALGVYVHKVNELALVKVPVPFEVQVTLL